MDALFDNMKSTLGIPDNPDSPSVRVVGQFNPQHTAIVYVDISTDGKMRAATAHYAKGGTFSDTDNGWKIYLANAVRGLRDILDSNPLPDEAEAATQLAAARFRYNFNEFTFKSKHHIFVVLGGTLEFDKRHPFSFIDKVFLTDGTTSRVNAKNKSFVNARHLDSYLPNLSTAYMENRYRKEGRLGNESDIAGDDPHHYTVNINVKIPVVTGPGAYIPIAIDPDTGNGMGPNP